MSNKKYCVIPSDDFNSTRPKFDSLEEAREHAQKRCSGEVARKFIVLELLEEYSARYTIDCTNFED